MSTRTWQPLLVMTTVALSLAACGSSKQGVANPSDCHPQQIVTPSTHQVSSSPVTYPPTIHDFQDMVRAEVIAAIPCKYSGVELSPDQHTLIFYAAPLDDDAKAAIATAASHQPSVAVEAKEGAQPEVVGDLQRERIGIPPKGVSSMGAGLDVDGRLKIDAFADSQDTANKLRRMILFAAADQSALERKLPAVEPEINITFPDDHPSSVRLTITISAPCRNPEDVHVNGGMWETQDPAPSGWVGQVAGTFNIEGGGKATFVGDDGQQMHFQQIGLSMLPCIAN